MLSRKKKPISWLKKKETSLRLLTRITRIFDACDSLPQAFQEVGDLLAEHLHVAERGFYTYNAAAREFVLQASNGQQNIFARYPTLTAEDFQPCQIALAEFGMHVFNEVLVDQFQDPCFLAELARENLQTLLHIPLIARGRTFGMLLLVSAALHQIKDDETDFFQILAQHISLATEKALIAAQYQQDAAMTVSQLRESQEQYRVVFEEASEAIILIEIATQRILEVNRQAEQLVGYAREELLRMTVNDFRVRRDEKTISARLLQLVARRRSVKLRERQIQRKDGQILWIELTASAIEYQRQQAILAIVRNITQRKRIELERSVMETVNQTLISNHDVSAVYQTVAQHLRKIFTFDWMDILLPGGTDATVRLLMSTNVNTNRFTPEEYEYACEGTLLQTIWQTGSLEIVNYTSGDASRSIPGLLGKELRASLFFPLHYQEQVIGMLHFGSYQSSFAPRHFDFLRRIATQIAIAIANTLLFRKINEERAIYKHLIENVHELVFQVDLKGKIIFTNHRVQNILGYTPDEITGTNFFSYVMPADLETARAGFRLVRRHEQPLSGEYRVVHKDGTILTISIYTRPIFEEGRAVGMHGIIQDITPPVDQFTTYRSGLHALIGRSHRMQEIYELIMSVAETDSTVLIYGESGTGKELIAQAIHAYSHRQNKPFIVVNCAAYSEHLLESELFGHEKGAFTGAHRRKLGRFELAKGGTIFLDEIGEIPLHSQILLLRVIQNKTFERVGGEHTLTTDVRIVAATNRNLVEEMKTGRFREDLYYRLNVISLDVPPLRQRKEDIPALVEHFLQKYAASTGKQVLHCSPRVLEVLMEHDWAGNVRELENAIERAVVMASGTVIAPENLPPNLRRSGAVEPEEKSLVSSDATSLYDQEKRLIEQTLKATRWNKYQTAKTLGITRSTLYSKLKKYGLNPD